MSTTLETSSAVADATRQSGQRQQNVAEQLQEETTAVRVKIRWPSTRKTLSQAQTQQAAGTFEADIKSVSASKKLFDTRHPAFREMTAIKTKVSEYWKSNTLPFTEPGIRLIRRSDIEAFDQQMALLRSELTEATGQLELQFDELVSQARSHLGDLFDPSDYQMDLGELFGIEWDYPSCRPPEYLLQVSPQLYYSECARVQQRFDEAVNLAEQAFADELAQLIDHLSERLSGNEDGSPKIFRDSAVTHLSDFFAKFRRLSIGSNEQLEQLVEQAQAIVQNVDPQQLRESEGVRRVVSERMESVQSGLDQLMIDRPRRNIHRRSR